MNNWIISKRLYLIGAAVGAIAGFLYWKQAGCLTGACSIASNPINGRISFAFFGAVQFEAFKKQPKTTETKAIK